MSDDTETQWPEPAPEPDAEPSHEGTEGEAPEDGDNGA
jgi:hypothetical protein